MAISNPYAHLKTYVISTTLDTLESPVELYAGDPLDLVRRLKSEDGLDLYLCGGGKLAGALLTEIDRLIVKTYPVVAGSGIPDLSGAFNPTPFTPTQRHTFDNGATVTSYDRT